MFAKPEHVAVIMDGNRRWAEKEDLPVHRGHEKGKEVIRDVLDSAQELGIKYISLWALSLDNTRKRSEDELEKLMDIFRDGFLELAEDDDIHEREVKINVVGRWKEVLPERVVKAINKAIDKTKDYSNYFLNLLVSYSGKDEMLHSIEKVVEKKSGEETVNVRPEDVKENLFTSDFPPVDLMIRTGGEPHNSTGFMMWDVANAQYFFSEKLWPDFSGEDFTEAVEDYRSRDRRFGA